MKICGIDIGLDGGLCFMDGIDYTNFILYKIPITKIGNKKDVDLKLLFSILNSEGPDLIIYEDIKTIFGVSKTTMFSLGKQIGYIKAYAAFTETTTYKIAPKKWQEIIHSNIALIQIDGKYKESFYKSISALYNILPENIIKDKFFKQKRYDDGLIDAYLLAYYIFLKCNNKL